MCICGFLSVKMSPTVTFAMLGHWEGKTGLLVPGKGWGDFCWVEERSFGTTCTCVFSFKANPHRVLIRARNSCNRAGLSRCIRFCRTPESGGKYSHGKAQTLASWVSRVRWWSSSAFLRKTCTLHIPHRVQSITKSAEAAPYNKKKSSRKSWRMRTTPNYIPSPNLRHVNIAGTIEVDHLYQTFYEHRLDAGTLSNRAANIPLHVLVRAGVYNQVSSSKI